MSISFKEKINLIKEIIDEDDLKDVSDKNRESAIKRAHEVFGRAKIRGRLPHHHSKNKQESLDADFVLGLKRAKQGEGRRKWYPEILDVIHSYGFNLNFDLKNMATCLTEVLSRIDKVKKLPSRASDNKQERLDAEFIKRLKMAKNCKGNCIWYPEYDNIIKRYNCEYIFNSLEDNMIGRLKMVLSRVVKNKKLPSRSNNKQERSDAYFLSSLKKARNYKGSGIWRGDYDQIIKKHSCKYVLKYFGLHSDIII